MDQIWIKKKKKLYFLFLIALNISCGVYAVIPANNEQNQCAEISTVSSNLVTSGTTKSDANASNASNASNANVKILLPAEGQYLQGPSITVHAVGKIPILKNSAVSNSGTPYHLLLNINQLGNLWMKNIEINTNIDTNIGTNNFIINSRINKPTSQNYFYIHGVANIPSVLLLSPQEKKNFCKNRDTFDHNNIFNNIFEYITDNVCMVLTSMDHNFKPYI